MWQRLRESRFLSFLSLFTSFGTLVCCAIPSTLVLLGLGAGLAGIVGKFPALTWPSENKGLVFGASFLMLILSYGSLRMSTNQVCPAGQKEDCMRTKSWTQSLFYVTLGINLIGAFYAFLLPRLL